VTQHDREPGETGTEQATAPATTTTEETRTGRERRRTRTRGPRAGRGRSDATTTSAPAEGPDDEGPDAAGSDAAPAATAEPVSDDPAAAERPRGDGRSRAARDSVEAASDGAGTATDGDDEEDGDDGSDGARRRRRRGRRGRGRGRGRGGAGRREGDEDGGATDDTGSAGARAESVGPTASGTPADATGDEPPEDDEHGAGAAGGSGGRARRRSSKKGRTGTRDDDARGDTTGDTTGETAEDTAGDGAGDGDEDVEKAIARSGTRVAAKRGRRNGGSGGNGGRRGAQRPGGVPEEVRRAILEGPPRTMLVTAKQDRTQIAVLEDRTVVEHYVTRKEDVTFVGNIYMARVQNVLPGMEAAFLDIGKGRNGVLYAGEVLYDELDLEEDADERIENALKPGQKVLVQVTKDPMGSKGPRLTMHLSLAGRYMVLAPNSDLFGISRKLTDQERDRLRRVVKKVKPDDHGIIVRTAAEGASDEQLTADLERLLAKWARVEETAKDAKALTTVYEEPALVVKVIRDNFGPEFERCIVDDEELYHQVRGYLDEVAPELLDKVELYGQPTLDAQARAAGAPSAVAATTNGDRATSDGEATATTTSDDFDGEASDADDTDGGEAAPTTAASTDTDDTDADEAAATTAGAAPDTTAGEHEGAGSSDVVAVATTEDRPNEGDDDAAAAAGDDTPAPASGLTAEQLAAARERQQELPSLFDAYDVADQLRKAMGKKVWLPSGGYLIIESTEAMKVIDVNTGKFTGGKDTNLEEVVLKTNLEAADEIVRQLRLRDMGGIIIIDFIDMLLKANQEQVVRRLKRELLRDRTKTRVSEVSRLGLVQMTRKNVSQGLIESFSHTCETCEGRGMISELG
jgi:Ribonuclease G/E